MIFSTILFLWVFLPCVLAAYYLIGVVAGVTGRSLIKVQNILLVLASLLFYAWGEPKYIVQMVFSVLLNWVSGLVIEGQEGTKRKAALALCVALNLGLLGYFKYFNFLIDIFRRLTGRPLAFAAVALPIGISFYTFQALSYDIDVYRGETAAQRNLIDMTLYISFFPQLIAGPIVKYHDIREQITSRTVTADDFAVGVKRFIFGLGKKVLLANTFAEVVDAVYACEPWNVSSTLLWLAAVLYMLQIYFDFSGYSDMAIGMGRMFGFHFQENFALPYTATSIRDFWRRWHISLSGWFKEYVYIPLGGNRKGRMRTYVNLVIVFFLTGLWHGAGFSFIFWGLYHGFFSIVERVLDERKKAGAAEENAAEGAAEGQSGRWSVPKHLYTLAVVLAGWVFFRADTLSGAAAYLAFMFLPHSSALRAVRFVNSKLLLCLCAGIFGCGPAQALLKRFKGEDAAFGKEAAVSLLGIAGFLLILWLSILMLVNDTYNPFIYFRF